MAIIFSEGLYGEEGIAMNIVSLVKMTLQDMDAKVIVEGRTGEEFTLTGNMRQGDALSATLFNTDLQRALYNVVQVGHISYKSGHMLMVVLISKN